MKKLYLSHTAWDTNNKCGYKYFLKYKEKIKPYIPVRYPLVTGVAFHNLVDEMYRTCNFSYDWLRYNWKPKFLEALDTETSSFTSNKGYERYLNYGYGLIKRFYDFAEPNGYLIKPIKSEWGFRIPYNGFYLVGKVDLIIDRPKVPYIEVLDHKTGWKLPTQEEVNNNLQLMIYDWAVKEELKLENTRTGIFLPRKSKVIFSDARDSSYSKALSEFDNLHKSISSNNFEPNLNSCEWCEFKNYCKYFNNIKKTP